MGLCNNHEFIAKGHTPLIADGFVDPVLSGPGMILFELASVAQAFPKRSTHSKQYSYCRVASYVQRFMAVTGTQSPLPDISLRTVSPSESARQATRSELISCIAFWG
mmetsp:Transcript_90665/g.157137  ORF Transcript_90665/g.157137 Transcript_90665/m.157137 type:complete len:107 (-) Transcript_90665:1030-1350(-)